MQLGLLSWYGGVRVVLLLCFLCCVFLLFVQWFFCLSIVFSWLTLRFCLVFTYNPLTINVIEIWICWTNCTWLFWKYLFTCILLWQQNVNPILSFTHYKNIYMYILTFLILLELHIRVITQLYMKHPLIWSSFFNDYSYFCIDIVIYEFVIWHCIVFYFY